MLPFRLLTSVEEQGKHPVIKGKLIHFFGLHKPLEVLIEEEELHLVIESIIFWYDLEMKNSNQDK